MSENIEDSPSETQKADLATGTDFIRALVESDAQTDRFGGRVQTRFPPEPNGYLHIGHAKAICLDFGIAHEHDGICILRFDDTNPETEDESYVDAILEDLQWLGFVPDEVRHSSDYFERLYEWAQHLVRVGLAYVDDQGSDEIADQRGGFGKPGLNSPFRDRTMVENLDLFHRMRDGEFPPGSRVLRARIDMQSENMQLRDPVMYRIRTAKHHRTGEEWPIYPTYDWAHGQGDAIEGVTHSLCTLEFSDNRALYEWFLGHVPLEQPAPYQTEFARLELSHTLTSKRKLKQLIDRGDVDGWDDPRLPTLRALRRRGYPAAALRDFCSFIGVSRTNSRHAIELLESFVRAELNAKAQRRMAVVRPLKLIITNWPTDEEGRPVTEYRTLMNNPENDADGTRQVPFSGELWIEQDDFRQEPPPKSFRLSPGREVRLRGGYLVTCTDAIEDGDGKTTEVHCTYDPATAGGAAADGRKVKATIHWVEANHALDATVALYERLFSADVPGERTGEPLDDLNPSSREIVTGCKVEPILGEQVAGDVVQFERLGYFAVDAENERLFHRTVGLRDEWAKIQKRQSGGS
ncbi:MAG: glutamine--tRNA ligase/YqeY domain fusion protein [Actinomycetota bacterium]|nr:glutamine--tRNA ligase/YqeY domain fusion protein [Actinomycetota bacterium]